MCTCSFFAGLVQVITKKLWVQNYCSFSLTALAANEMCWEGISTRLGVFWEEGSPSTRPKGEFSEGRGISTRPKGVFFEGGGGGEGEDLSPPPQIRPKKWGNLWHCKKRSFLSIFHLFWSNFQCFHFYKFELIIWGDIWNIWNVFLTAETTFLEFFIKKCVKNVTNFPSNLGGGGW